MTYPGDCYEAEHYDDELPWRMIFLGVLLMPFALLVRAVMALARR